MTRLLYDPFDGPLDLSKWNVRELNQSWTSALCYIHPSAVTTAHSELCLSAFPQLMGTKKFVGGRVDTRDKFAIGPGMEVRVKARLPKNPACWPGIWDGDYDDAPWLQPQNIPPKHGGERDYAETGLEHGADGVTQTWIAHHHTGTPRYYIPLDVAAPHWYIMRDYGDRFTLALDDKETFTVWRKDQPYWPFDAAQPFKLILDLDLLRPITQRETMYVDTVEILSLPVSVPAPGPLEPAPQPAPAPAPAPTPGGMMELAVRHEQGKLRFSVTGSGKLATTINKGTHHIAIQKPPPLAGERYRHYSTADFTLPAGYGSTVLVELAENETKEVIDGQSYTVTLGPGLPTPTTTDPKITVKAKLKILGLDEAEIAVLVHP